MELSKCFLVVAYGFVVWTLIAPRFESPRFGELFLAYMTALLFSLEATSELILIKPVAFFFTVGGVLAFFFTILRRTVHISVRQK
nr:hypothetical protein [uncultured Anaeromusa sp.]